MVRHIVLYFLKNNEVDSKELLKEKFLSMRGKIPCLKSIEVGVDFLNSERSCDVSLTCTFDSRNDLEAYIAHPIHIPVKDYVKSVVEKSISCDYEI